MAKDLSHGGHGQPGIAVVKYEPAADQTPSLIPGIDYVVVPMEYE